MIVAISVGGCLSCNLRRLVPLCPTRKAPCCERFLGIRCKQMDVHDRPMNIKARLTHAEVASLWKVSWSWSWPWPSYIVLNWTSGERGLDGSSWLDFMVNAELFVNSIFIIS